MNDEDDKERINNLYHRILSELEETGSIIHIDDPLSLEGNLDGVPVVPPGTFHNAGFAFDVHSTSYAYGRMSDGYVIFIADQVKASLADQSPGSVPVARGLLRRCAQEMTPVQWQVICDILGHDPGQEEWKKTVL